MAPEDIANQLHRAETLIAVRRFAEAAAIAYETAAIVPGDPRPCLIAARAELGLGNNKRAEEAAAAAIRYSPDLPVAHRLVAMARINSGFKESVRFARRQWGRSAVDPAKQAVALDPEEAAGYWILAQATDMAGHLKAAKLAADQGARLAPFNAESWRVRAQVARSIGDLKVAESCAREALRLDPQHYAASNELGLVLQRRGKTTKSLGQFANTAALDPTLGPARMNMLRHSKQVTYMIILVLLCPLAILWPLWFAASVGLNRLIWTWAPTRTFLEQRSYARAQRRGQKADSKASGKTSTVPPGAPIKGPYFISTQLIRVILVIIVVFYLLPTTILTFVNPSRFWGPALGAWIVSALLFWPIHHRRHTEGQEFGINQQVAVST